MTVIEDVAFQGMWLQRISDVRFYPRVARSSVNQGTIWSRCLWPNRRSLRVNVDTV